MNIVSKMELKYEILEDRFEMTSQKLDQLRENKKNTAEKIKKKNRENMDILRSLKIDLDSNAENVNTLNVFLKKYQKYIFRLATILNIKNETDIVQLQDRIIVEINNKKEEISHLFRERLKLQQEAYEFDLIYDHFSGNSEVVTESYRNLYLRVKNEVKDLSLKLKNIQNNDVSLENKMDEYLLKRRANNRRVSHL